MILSCWNERLNLGVELSHFEHFVQHKKHSLAGQQSMVLPVRRRLMGSALNRTVMVSGQKWETGSVFSCPLNGAKDQEREMYKELT